MRKFFFPVLLSFTFLLCGCGVKGDFVIADTVIGATETKKEVDRLSVLINKNSKIYHLDFECVYASRMAENNRLEIEVKNTEYLSEHGYTPCSKCSDTTKNKNENN